MASPRILLVDGNSFFFRAFFGSLSMATNEEDKSAVYTAIRMLKRFLKEQEDYQQICFFFDISRKNFRRDIFAEYKAHRSPTPKGLIYQFPIFKDFLTRLSVQIFSREGYEADDLVASAATQAEQQKLSIDILSSDRDLLQMVSPSTSLFILGSPIHKMPKITPDNFYERFSLHPSQIVDFKALAGDSSDNIPGVEGIGPKTAIKLLKKYQTINGIYQSLDQLTPGLQQKLIQQKSTVDQFQKIVQLVRDLPLNIDFSSFSFDFSSPQCRDFYNKHKLFSLINENKSTKAVASKRQKKFFS